jgi:hypothetical protein
MQKQEVVDLVVASLSRYLGTTMAEAAARMQCEKLGLGATVTEAEVEALLSRLAGGLHVFVGREKTDQALDEIRVAVKGAAR